MKNKIQYGFVIFTSILALIGLIILIFSVDNGLNSAGRYLRSVGGSMDSDSFRLVEDRYILSNMIIGGTMLFVGLSSLCVGVYKLFKEIKGV